MKNEQKYFIRTPRLAFRCWCESDLELALGLWGDEKVTQFIDARGHLSMEQIRQRLEQEIATGHKHGVQYWPIFLLKHDEHAGCCGLRPYDLSKGIYEIGFHIRSIHWRNGYAYEAAQAVIQFAFNHLKSDRLFAGHHPENKGSGRLLRKLGFHYTHTEYYPPTGLNHPSYCLEAVDWVTI